MSYEDQKRIDKYMLIGEIITVIGCLMLYFPKFQYTVYSELLNPVQITETFQLDLLCKEFKKQKAVMLPDVLIDSNGTSYYVDADTAYEPNQKYRVSFRKCLRKSGDIDYFIDSINPLNDIVVASISDGAYPGTRQADPCIYVRNEKGMVYLFESDFSVWRIPIGKKLRIEWTAYHGISDYRQVTNSQIID